MIIYSAISLDVAQCSFNKCRALYTRLINAPVVFRHKDLFLLSCGSEYIYIYLDILKDIFLYNFRLFFFYVSFCINCTTVKPEHIERHFVTHNIKIQQKYYKK